jgi:endonuclease YncB( thermonuclease family)
VVAICFKGAKDLSRWIVESGWAVAFRKYSLDYVTDEERAQHALRGIWIGTFDKPWT